MNLTLREVTLHDVDLLYQWANDKTVRQNAFHTESIPYDTHCAWFARVLMDEDVLMYLLHDADNGQDIGQIRLSVENQTALIDYSIDEKWRGHGYGSQIILMAEEALQEKRTDVIYCKAQVKYENPVSAKVFEKCGYDRQELEQYLEYTKKIRG